MDTTRRWLTRGGLVAVVGALVLIRPWEGGDLSAEASGAGQATLQGLTVRVLAAEASEIGTTLTFTVQGKPELGDVVAAFGRPALVDSSGDRRFALRATRDDLDPRQHTVYFDALRTGETVTFVVTDLEFETRAEQQARVARAQAGEAVTAAGTARAVHGLWKVEALVAQAKVPGRELMLADASVAFGPGRLVVERVVVVGAELTVTGRIEGVAPDQFQDLEIAPARLAIDGTDQLFLGGRSGYGPGNGSFELRFSASTGRAAQLTVPFNLALRRGADLAPSTSLDAFAGSSATLALSLPD